MNTPTPLIQIEKVRKCRIIKRLNRFVVMIKVRGKDYRAHINNTGRLEEFHPVSPFH